jgi:flagellin-like hook-associated protein FlgL
LETQYNTVLNQVANLARDSNYGGQNLTYRESEADGAENKLSVELNEYAASNTSVASSLDVQGFSVNLTSGASDETDGRLTIRTSNDPTKAAFTINDVTEGEADYDANKFASAGNINTAIEKIDNFIGQLRTEAQKLSSSLSTIQIRADFTSEMVNTLNTGADNLTLADMNEEGANMLMLQTRQNLGTTSLSMASQAAQAVLRLF